MCLFRSCRGSETGPHAFLSVCCQRELRDQKQAAPNLSQRPVHPSFGIVEDSVSQHPLEQTLGFLRRIFWLYADQREQAAIDGANGLGTNHHVRSRDPLDQRYHIGPHGRRRGLTPIGRLPAYGQHPILEG